MRGVLEFLERPPVLVTMGVIMLVVAIFAFATGGRGVVSGVVLVVAGGHSVWRGVSGRRR